MITGKGPPVAEEAQTVTQEPPAAADQAFADKLAKRSPPNQVDVREFAAMRARIVVLVRYPPWRGRENAEVQSDAVVARWR
jgi:hypothetical protein